KAIKPVDFRGHPANLSEIKEIADKHNLRVIEDGSHSIGSSYTHNGKEHFCGDGTHADLCTYSFHPVKHITTGEGGAILTNDPIIDKKVKCLRTHGMTKEPNQLNKQSPVNGKDGQNICGQK
ncbi:DegT/DnrJ/EryC1/StrS family aminotransferase, partial [Vibrio caribbeanicus]|uniref:DegT/DnrJ/EryC1/StrS family aminotransferase n=1 Tax=Vibrio caribbeanicus TaxID=701175 RepID=UPI0030D80A57